MGSFVGRDVSKEFVLWPSVVADIHSSCVNATSRDPLNPLAAPGGSFERIREVLCFVYDLTIEKLHNADGVCRPALVGDGVFRDPESPFPENSPDVEA